MRAKIVRLATMGGLCLALSAPALAQAIRSDEWRQGTTLNGFAGVAVDSARSGPLLGGAVGWEVTPRLTIEGSGAWLDFGERASAFAGTLEFRVRLAGRRTIDPFVQAGVGLYRASFDRAAEDVPSFYARRWARPVPAVAPGRTFTDPTLVVGGGVNLFATRHFAVRPEVDATFVLHDGRSHVVTSVAVHAVFHIEEHPVTPAARDRADRRRAADRD